MRLFIALDLPNDIRARLSCLAAGVPGVRWIPPENLHLTLRFVGEVDGGAAEELDAELAAIDLGAFALTLSGVGVFERGRHPHTLWAGVAAEPALPCLHERIELAAQRAGLEPESRRFKPHVTLGRLKQRPGHHLVDWLEVNSLLRAGPFTVCGFTLFRSHLGRGAAHYEALGFYPLSDVASGSAGICAGALR